MTDPDLEIRVWCSAGRHFAPRSDFSPAPSRASGLAGECNTHQRERQARARRGPDGLTKRQRKVVERRARVKPLAEQGIPAIDIARRLGVSRGTIEEDMRAMDLGRYRNGQALAPRAASKVLENASMALIGPAAELGQLDLTNVELDPEDCRRWLKELDKASSALNRVRRQLKGTLKP